jgi:hypothetical protein
MSRFNVGDMFVSIKIDRLRDCPLNDCAEYFSKTQQIFEILEINGENIELYNYKNNPKKKIFLLLYQKKN